IIGLMCQTLSDEQIIVLASRSELALPTSIVTEGLTLPTSVLGGLVEIEWVSSNIEALTNDGQLGVSLTQPQQVELTATLKRGAASQTLGTTVTVLPQHIIPYEIELLPEGKSVAVSPDMYGLFYEDIN